MSDNNPNVSEGKKLAIEGGKPVRAKPIAPLVEIGSSCKKRI